MFKIGEFSKLSQIPIKTLRYYHELGLLAPAETDTFTGYRYYTASQLPRLNRILALKELGFSLEQVRQVLDERVTVEQLRGMLRLKQAEVEQVLAQEQSRLRRIESRLRQIEQENAMPPYEVVIKQVEPLWIAAARGIAPSYSSVGPLYEELFTYLAQQGIVPVGPPLGIYYDEEYKEKDVDVEAAVPVLRGIDKGSGRVKFKELPAAAVASVMRRGPYDDFTPAYQALMQWIQDNGYHIIGPNREIYLQGPDATTDPDDYITEIQFPVAPNG